MPQKWVYKMGYKRCFLDGGFIKTAVFRYRWCGFNVFDLGEIMEKYFIGIIFICLISGCNFRKQDKVCQDTEIVLFRYGNGTVNTKVVVNCIDTNLKTTIGFYRNGDTALVESKFKGKRRGMTKEFNQKGELERIRFYTDGLMDSIWQAFYKNGRPRSVQYGITPQLISDMEFDSNGIIRYYNYLKDRKFIAAARYLPGGEIDSFIGNYLVDIKSNKAKYDVGDSLKFFFVVATPPHDSIKFSAALYSVDEDTLKLFELPVANSVARLFSKIDKVGSYIIKYELIAQHKKGTVTNHDPERGTLRFTVTK